MNIKIDLKKYSNKKGFINITRNIHHEHSYQFACHLELSSRCRISGVGAIAPKKV